MSFDKCVNPCSYYHSGRYLSVLSIQRTRFGLFFYVLLTFIFYFLVFFSVLFGFIIWFQQRTMRENLFNASPLASDDLLTVFEVPWLIDAKNLESRCQSLLPSSRDILLVYMSVSVSKLPLLIRTMLCRILTLIISF